MFNKKGWLKYVTVRPMNGMLSVLKNGTVEECLMALNDTCSVAVGGEFYSMFSHFGKYIVVDICYLHLLTDVDICYVCDCLLSHKQLFYVWRHSHIMTISSWTLNPGFKFPASFAARMQAYDLSSANQVYYVREIIPEVSNTYQPFLCKVFHFIKWVMAGTLSF